MTEQVTKTIQVKNLLSEGRETEALAIVAGFRHSFSKEEQRMIKIAHECLAGNSHFYRSIGIDVDGTIEDAKAIIREKYKQ